MTDEEALKRWPETMIQCQKCGLVHESFIACPSEPPCEFCTGKGGWEWNRHAEPPCWESALCPQCGSEPDPTATPPEHGLCNHERFTEPADGGRYCLDCGECIA